METAAPADGRGSVDGAPGAAASVLLRALGALALAVVASLLLTAASAEAAGGLTQKAGTAGCISESGSGGACVDGTGLNGGHAVAVSADGENVYAVGLNSDAVAIFDRGTDGELTQKAGAAGCIAEGGGAGCSSGRALNGASSVTVSPDGDSVYVTALNGDGVAVFDRAADGTLSQKAGAAGCVTRGGGSGCTGGRGLDAPRLVTVSPDGESVYVASANTDAVAVFDRAADGALTQKLGLDGCVSETGSGPCADGTALDGAHAVTVSPDGDSVYVASLGSDAVAVFDRAADGALTQKAGTAGCISESGSGGACVDGTGLDGARGVTVSADGQNVYAATVDGDAVTIFDRAADGALTQKAGTDGCVSETGSSGACADGTGLDGADWVVVSADGESVYATAQNSNAVTIFDRAADGTVEQRSGSAGCISDNGSAGACVDGTALDGPRQIAVSTDGGNAYVASFDSDSVAIFDRTPLPETSIDSGPAEGAAIGTDSPSFGFSSDPAGADFECQLDGGAWEDCASPETVGPLADGPHSFGVRAVDADGDADPTPATRSFTVDTGLPDTEITSDPGQYSNDTDPSFEFTASDPAPSSGVDHFECRLDGGAWSNCTSGDSFATPEGDHSFEVRAVDGAGNADPSPASHSWMVDTTKPTITVNHPTVKEHFLLHEGELDYSCEDPESGGPPPVASGVPASQCTDTGFGDDIPLGPRLITFEATDRAGNSAEPITRAYVIDPPGYGAFLGADDPLAYYRMDEQVGSSEMRDRSGNGHDGTYQNGIALGRDSATACERRPHPPRACELAGEPYNASAPPKNDAAFFPARDGHGYVNGISAPRDAYTMEAWVKPRTGADMMVMGHGGGGQLFISGGKLALRQVQDTVGGGGPTLTPDKWWHVAATWNGSETRLFVNGNQVAFSDSANKQPSGTSTFYVGYGEMAPWFHGDLDEVAYYDTALDRHAFQDRYAIGTAKDKPSLGVGELNTAGPFTDPTMPKNGGLYSPDSDKPHKIDFDCTDPDGAGDIQSCEATVDGTPVADGDELPRTPGDHDFVVTAEDQHGNTYIHTHTYTVKPFSWIYGHDAPIAYYRLGDGSGQPMKDSSPHGRDGEYKNDTDSGPVGVAGDGNKARQFFGAGGYGYVNGISAPRYAATMAAWVNADDGRDAAIVGHGDAGELFIRGGTFRFRHMDDESGADIVDSGVVVKPGRWQMVAGVWDGVEIKIYVDGKLKASEEATRRPSSISTFYVGFGELEQWFKGAIDEVAYYEKALDANRIYQFWLADPPADLSAGGGSGSPGDTGGSGSGGSSGGDGGGSDSGSGGSTGGDSGSGGSGDDDSGEPTEPDEGGELAAMAAEFVQRPKLKRRALVAKVACSQARDCKGTAIARAKLGKRGVKLGSKPLRINAGAEKTMRFKLNRKLRRKAAKGKLRKVKVVLAADGGRVLARSRAR